MAQGEMVCPFSFGGGDERIVICVEQRCPLWSVPGGCSLRLIPILKSELDALNKNLAAVSQKLNAVAVMLEHKR